MGKRAWRVKEIKNIVFFTIFILLISGENFTVHGQTSANREYIPAAETSNLLRTIQLMAPDTSARFPVIRNFQAQLNTADNFIQRKKSLKAIEKEKAKRSLVYFIHELNNYLARKKINLYELDEAFDSYQLVLAAILEHRPLLQVMSPMSTISTQLIASSFTQYKEFSLLDDIATYKRVSSSPEFILQFLENKPAFRFADSLLLDAVIYDPVNIVYYLRKDKSVLQQRIRNAGNNYIRQVASLSENKNAAELALFTPQLVEGKLQADEIIKARAEPVRYFQLMVNSVLGTNSSAATNFRGTLQNGIREKALAFFVNEINELHSSPDAVRFASVNGLRPQDLYFIITTCGDELYTSSYLGLYKRLMSHFNGPAADSLFELVEWKNFRVFMRMAANYNVLEDFLKRLGNDKLREVLDLFIANIETDQRTALEKAMDIADSFSALSGAPQTLDLIQEEIRYNHLRCVSRRNFMGMRLYSILDKMLMLSRQKNGLEKLWAVLGDYETLKQSSLKDKNGNITEVVLFYGDEDGVASFNNFLRGYTDKSKWQVTRNAEWVKIQSVSGTNLSIYANLPLDVQTKADINAQDNLFNYLRSNEIEPSIMVHRGHSYHLDKTLKRLTPTVKLSILGSCGGYNKSISIASINPDIQVIGSKKTGSKSINDPMLDLINETLSGGKDLLWPEIWTSLALRFKKDATMSTTFSEYFPPSHNLGLFVLKLYQNNHLL